MERLGEPFGFSVGGEGGRRARRTVRDLAAKVIAAEDVLDDVELMTAEAVANAVLHGSGLVTVTVATDGRALRVEIADDGPAHTDEAGADPHGRRRLDHGRGLTVIDALAGEWGLDQCPGRTRLWFTVETRRPSAGA
ncbi:ATP-binding protein [Actinomadura latina]|uniref:ATP-binding protein n=2 Tax=Actinomadura latina TaxID=163603 RepID=A0A846Z6S1_9ACTN|nr:ATP-binding protein [Actinomadura latina]